MASLQIITVDQKIELLKFAEQISDSDEDCQEYEKHYKKMIDLIENYQPELDKTYTLPKGKIKFPDLR